MMRNESAITSERPRIAVVLVPGCPVFEASIPYEVFGLDRRDIAGPLWYQLSTHSMEEPTVCLQQGFSIPTSPIEEIAGAHTVIVPGCHAIGETVPRAYTDALVAAADNGARIVSLCDGAFILAQAGLLDGRTATTHWMYTDTLRSRYPRVAVDPSIIYVRAGNVWTSAGAAAGIDLCLALVREDYGAAVANEVACRMVTAPHRSGSQAQYYHRRAPGTNRGITGPLPEDILIWARGRLPHGLNVAALAARANVSHRTLTRRFHEHYKATPQQWILTEKIKLACVLLETRIDYDISIVARESGFGTAQNLRQHFKKHLECSPQQYRSSFAATAPLRGAETAAR